MVTLSLSPRFDLFHFELPKDWFPEEVLTKYGELLQKNQTVISNPVDYINESIQGITIPGISELTMVQEQTSTNDHTLGKLRYNREPSHDNYYKVPTNPIQNIGKDFTVTFRQNQGLYNYFMIYETVFWHICKPQMFDKGEDVFKIDILNERGEVCSSILLYQPLVSGMDGLSFSYNKAERSAETFDLTFNFNNINFDFVRES